MRTQYQDEVKVAVYSANMPAEEQRFQDMWLAVFMIFSALTVVGLQYLG